MNAKATLEDAIILAAGAHRRQVDQACKSYILHPLRAMLQLEGEAGRITAGLHDVLEDPPVTIDNLRQAGYGEKVLQALEALTRRTCETYAHFIERPAKNPLTRRVKVAELAVDPKPEN